ncbi:hypothetical protein SNEBB_006137 [Seison nebaliae]|nr:hypothetical protein SNEBB_006137 [Seison nebaliae]
MAEHVDKQKGRIKKVDESRLHKKLKHEKKLVRLKKEFDQIKEEKKQKHLNLVKKKDVVDQFKLHISIAIPGSILANAQSPELRSYVAGQIARTAAIYCVNEIIIFDEFSESKTIIVDNDDPNQLFIIILQYLECPQYLRKQLFPMQKRLKFAGLLNPLEISHHQLRYEDVDNWNYREAIVLNKKYKQNRTGIWVDCGLRNKPVPIAGYSLEENTRVTIRRDESTSTSSDNEKSVKFSICSPLEPYAIDNLYWGYSVRYASNFKETLFPEGPSKYHMIIGTSDKGDELTSTISHKFKFIFSKFKREQKKSKNISFSVNHKTNSQTTTTEEGEKEDNEKNETNIKINFFRVLIVFGGLAGLEPVIESDEQIIETDMRKLFDVYVNSCEKQGSRTIRTEEAVLISLSRMRPLLDNLVENRNIERKSVATQWTEENNIM